MKQSGIILITIFFMLDFAQDVWNAYSFYYNTEGQQAKKCQENDNQCEKVYTVLYSATKLPLVLIIFMYMRFATGCIKDTSIARKNLYRILFWGGMAINQVGTMIVVAIVYGLKWITTQTFLTRLGMQVVFLLAYCYLIGIVNRFYMER